MNLRILAKDADLLETIEDYRILTVPQVAYLHSRTQQMARRRLHALRRAGLVGAVPLRGGGKKGRPEQVFFLSKDGSDLLAKRRPVASSIVTDFPLEQSMHCLRHDLLANWFRIHLGRIDQTVPGLGTWFLPYSVVVRARIHVVEDSVPPVDGKTRASTAKPLRFIPDGVFALTETKTRRVFLFFLEVDMGTRPISSLSDVGRDAREKIVNYEEYFRLGGYKVYERVFGRAIEGFRLLILADTEARLRNLSLLCTMLGGMDFVWISDREKMFSHGLAAAIWTVGGNQSEQPRSIVGARLCRESALPALSH